ncbi:glycosyltransferase involved in cell wall biosynthesis [Arcanobacterium wilhelmae]|uniref:Glycosyltransferase involved in cell wall biosynthesis n=1 Tax=Arcanobacterium wilhelmae TaxID=1803177 RepID=A0ABT9NCJ0_9ACTO|nr:glycosyltransferase family 2 protein [Arcanobacterium wilhelmae]MDP9801228.1 glycosyltransferase involved in cell wall biosynthesis [Arcanobacterium wilhelmae]WFN90577.1 glycosyltransferase family 2 protein [Arcanobacterium wilhelmae]
MTEFPSLAVIVPAYKVEAYLRDCVESLLTSDYPNFEVVIVDDGSPDDTGMIADQLATEDPRVRVIHKENGGLGAARNTGVEQTDSDLIAFVDSDDQVPSHAYSRMYEAMQKSGSGMVVGGVERFNSTRRWAPWFVEEAHSVERLGITGQQFPSILWNVFAWSKLFTRDYFKRVVGEFPVGVLYEDQEVSAKMYLGGEPFDVIPDIIYRWRERDDASSITQNKTSLDDLGQRLHVMKETEKVIQASGDEATKEYWYRKALNEDLWWYYRVVPQASWAFWLILCEGVRDIAANAPSSSIAGGPAKRHDLIRLAIRGDRQKFNMRLRKA